MREDDITEMTSRDHFQRELRAASPLRAGACHPLLEVGRLGLHLLQGELQEEERLTAAPREELGCGELSVRVQVQLHSPGAEVHHLGLQLLQRKTFHGGETETLQLPS